MKGWLALALAFPQVAYSQVVTAEIPDAAQARAWLGDSDPAVRVRFLEWASRPELGTEDLEPRIAGAIAGLAQEPDPDRYTPWARFLARQDHPDARVWLLQDWRTGPEARARASAKEVQVSPQAVPLLRAALVPWAASGEPALPPGVLAALLPTWGALLGDLPVGDLQLADVRPLIAGTLALEGPVRAAATEAMDRWLLRLTEREQPERTEQAFALMAQAGLDGRWVAFERCRMAFFPMADGDQALARAQELRRLVDRLPAEGEQAAALWRFRCAWFTGLAEVARGRGDAAQKAFEAGLLDQAAALARLGWVDTSESVPEVPAPVLAQTEELLLQRTMLLLGCNLAAHLSAVPDSDPVVLERFREAHLAHLEAQVLYTRRLGGGLGGWDGLFEADLSPYRLLLHGREFRGGLGLPKLLELEQWMARGLATVSPWEMPGFEPFPDVPPRIGNPFTDLERRARIDQIHLARLEQIEVEIERLSRRIGDAQTSPLMQVPEADLEESNRLDRQRRILLMRLEQGFPDGRKGTLLDVRVSGGHGLRLARSLRSAGQRQAGEDLVRRFRADLEDGGIGNSWYYLGQERLARADMELGANLSDSDRPKEAERILLAATERLQSIVDRLREVGVDEAGQAPYVDLLAQALVSLAVNSNVRLSQPEAALAFYERAYALKQDEFMRVLLACYRARGGRVQEARALLASVTPAPSLYYNLACTHALLGETEQALAWLRLEMEENQKEPAARARQAEWARADPDLISLRGMPEFEALTGPQ
ncbi:MAG: hypothetical protein R3F33_15825 [Planctomycetota bacterium]